MSQFNSAVYQGHVVHKRFQVKEHQFNYPMYMMGLDLDELDALNDSFTFFSVNRLNLLNFRFKDYPYDSNKPLKQSILEKIESLGGSIDSIDRVVFLGQVRCLGFYFSPVNFYFCFDHDDAIYLLAEVHNTPWNEYHHYLINIQQPQEHPKEFHVSPFMDLNMNYQWRIKYQADHINIHIENWNENKLFEATLNLRQYEMSSTTILSILKQWPAMTMTIVRGIYWQAAKLFAKRIPYHSHP